MKINRKVFSRKRSVISPIKELTDEHLREADKLVRLKRYEEAVVEIESAHQIDPENPFICSLLERTRYMIEKENEKRSHVFGETNITSENRMEAISELFASAEKFITEKKYPKALNELAKVFRIDPKNYNAQELSDRIVTLMRAENALKKTRIPQPIATEADIIPSNKQIPLADNKVQIQPATDNKIQEAENEINRMQPVQSIASEYGRTYFEKMSAYVSIDKPAQLSNISTKEPIIKDKTEKAEKDIEKTQLAQSIISELDETLLEEPSKFVNIDTPTQTANISKQQPTTKDEIHEAENDIHRKPYVHSIVSEFDEAFLEVPSSFEKNEVQMQSNSISLPMPKIYNEPQEEVRRFVLYKELLKECWADGFITPEESELLHRMRSQYSISFDTHCKLEVAIKIDAYVDTLRIVWQDGVVTNNEQEVLEIMRKKFGITPEEQAAAIEKFITLRKAGQSKAKLLVVDYDHDNSIYIARALIGYGYDVKIEQFPDEALHFLDTHTPNLILSEAVFPRFETDGFEFFQRTRSDKRLSQIPFLMMSSSDDSSIMRAGLRMGVDYFIPKPLHIGYMAAIVEGRLKSFHQTTVQN